MKKSIYTILTLAVIILWSSCRKDFESEASTGNLQFSKDTVYLDTVFTDIGSSTYTLKVYNRSDDDIYIPSIRLGLGETSKYRLNVDGIAGKTFEDVEILAKDSMFIFIETTVDITDFATDTQFLYTDAIEFDNGSNAQKVELVTLVQDAVFLYPQRFDDGTTESLLLGVDEDGVESRIEGFFLEDAELNWTNEKPYVIYGYAAVGASKTLSIDPGARVHFHRDSGIIVGNEGSIQVNGILSSPETQDGEVIFEGDRLEPGFADIPGQWGTIWLTNGSTNNRFDHATIKNATVGILMENNDGTAVPTLTMNNSQIHNSANVGLLARTGHVEANNLVIGNAGQASLYCNLGGQYTFKHCTFANYWNNSFRQFPAVLIDNYLDLGTSGILTEDLNARFSNCIIYGNSNKELILDPNNDAAFSFNFNNCLIRFEDFGGGAPLFEFPNPLFYQDNVLNDLPDFKNTELSEFIIGADSNAIGIGNSLDVITEDILGVTRTLPPDAGAYQHTSFEDEED